MRVMSTWTFPIARLLPTLVFLAFALTDSSAGEPTEDRAPAATPAPEIESPPTEGLKSIEVFPSELSLTTALDRQSVVVQATYENGITRDVTRFATITLAGPSLLRR